MKTIKHKLTSAELDARIVSMIQNGSSAEKEEGFSMLFSKFKPMVFIHLNKNLNFDSERANDLMMDVFTKIHLKMNLYSKSEGALSTWIFKITNNTLIDSKRKEKIQTSSIYELTDLDTNSNLSSPFSLLVSEERKKSLLSALNKINKDEVRKVLTLFFLGEKSYKELSDELDLNINTIKVIIHRGKKELKNILDKQGFVF